MRQIIAVCMFTLLLCNCQTDKNKVSQEENIRDPFPLILDTIGIENFIYSYDDEEPTWLTTAHNEIYYIGLKTDTIYLNPFISNTPPPLPPDSMEIKEIEFKERKNTFSNYIIDWLDYRAFKNWTETKIELRVDTLNRLFNSYPVLLTNIDSDTIIIGYGRNIPLIMEALDSTGNWKPIQKKFVHMCGVGLNSIILPPNECVLTLAPIFDGKHKTKLRLTMGKNHSQPFMGSINYRQFESRFNDYGEYKDEYKLEQQGRKTNR